VTIPAPEQLGVAPVRGPDAPADWTAARSRLRELGAVSFFLERLTEGGYRFSCWLPRSPGGTERIEARGGTEAEAVRLGLERAGRWKAQAH
jgi:hypothetical protein